MYEEVQSFKDVKVNVKLNWQKSVSIYHQSTNSTNKQKYQLVL